MLDELDLVDRSIGVVGHGCYTQIITIADVEFLQCLHGRAPAVATGMKRMLPDRAIYTLQGDGDMVSEGLAEVLHAAARGESITCLMLNNGVFGDTGGQMTATTTVGQRTKTDLDGRTARRVRLPDPVAEIVASFPGVALRRARRGRQAQRGRPHAALPARGVRVAARRRGLLAGRGPHHVPDRLGRPDRPGRRSTSATR